MAWRKACHDFLAQNPGQVVHQYVFSRLLNTAWFDAMTMRNIIAGFRTTGIFSINRDALEKKVPESQLISEKTEISYIPYPCSLHQSGSHMEVL